MKATGKTDAELYELQSGECFYCSRAMRPHPWRNKYPKQEHGYTRDHVIPQIHGGALWLNIVLACFKCNNDKGDRAPTLDELETCRLLYCGVALVRAREIVKQTPHAAVVILRNDGTREPPMLDYKPRLN